MSIKDPKGVGDFLWIVFLILIVGLFISLL
jgi:hypothetical protein